MATSFHIEDIFTEGDTTTVETDVAPGFGVRISFNSAQANVDALKLAKGDRYEFEGIEFLELRSGMRDQPVTVLFSDRSQPAKNGVFPKIKLPAKLAAGLFY